MHPIMHQLPVAIHEIVAMLKATHGDATHGDALMGLQIAFCMEIEHLCIDANTETKNSIRDSTVKFLQAGLFKPVPEPEEAN